MEMYEPGTLAGPYYLAVKIGGTKQQMAVGTADGRIAERRQVRLGKSTTAQNILQWIRETGDALRATWDVQGIGVGFGGPSTPIPA